MSSNVNDVGAKKIQGFQPSSSFRAPQYSPSAKNLTSLLSSSTASEPDLKKRKLEHVASADYKPFSVEVREGKLKMIESLDKIVEKSDSESEKLETKKMIYKLALEVEQNDHKGLKRKYEATEKELVVVKKDYADSQTHNRTQDQELRKLKSTTIDLKKEIESYKKKEDESKQVIADLDKSQKKEKDLQRQIAQLNRSAREQQEIISQIRSEPRVDHTRQIEKLKQELQALEAQFKAMESDLTILKKENKVLTEERNSSQGALKEEMEDKRAYKKENGELKISHQRKLEELEAQHGQQLSIVVEKIHSFANTLTDIHKM